MNEILIEADKLTEQGNPLGCVLRYQQQVTRKRIESFVYLHGDGYGCGPGNGEGDGGGPQWESMMFYGTGYPGMLGLADDADTAEFSIIIVGNLT